MTGGTSMRDTIHVSFIDTNLKIGSPAFLVDCEGRELRTSQVENYSIHGGIGQIVTKNHIYTNAKKEEDNEAQI